LYSSHHGLTYFLLIMLGREFRRPSKIKQVFILVFILVCMYLIGLMDSSAAEIAFFVVGDWGSPLNNPEMFSDQKSVASAMEVAALTRKPSFVLSVGDHAYPEGIQSLAEAEERFLAAFDHVYDKNLRSKPWYLTVGNHDCQGSASAQYEYAALNPSWSMEPHYKQVRVLADGTRLVMFVLDMCTFVCAAPGKPNFRCEGLWRGSARQRQDMIEWLTRELRSEACKDSSNWCVVAGHWPVFSFGGNVSLLRVYCSVVNGTPHQYTLRCTSLMTLCMHACCTHCEYTRLIYITHCTYTHTAHATGTNRCAHPRTCTAAIYNTLYIHSHCTRYRDQPMCSSKNLYRCW
jgi:hypothetical protein